MKKQIAFLCLVMAGASLSNNVFAQSYSVKSANSVKITPTKVSTPTKASTITKSTPKIMMGATGLWLGSVSSNQNQPTGKTESIAKTAIPSLTINSDYKKGYDVDAKPASYKEVLARAKKQDEQKTEWDTLKSGQKTLGNNAYNTHNKIESGSGGFDLNKMANNFMMYNLGNNAINAMRDAAMYKSHYNDPDVVNWRSASQQKALTDPALAARLKTLEEGAKKSGNPIKLCAGIKGGMYALLSESVAEKAQYPVEVVYTNGATDNARAIKEGRCDLGYTQSDLTMADAENLKQRQSVGLLIEPLMLMCKVDYDSVAAMPATVSVAVPEKTGSSDTFSSLKDKTHVFSNMKVISAMTAMDAIDQVQAGQADCAFLVSHPDSSFVKHADKNKLHLVSMVSSNIDNVDFAKQFLPVSIAGSRFNNLTGESWTEGLAVQTVLLVNNTWLDNNRSAYNDIYTLAQQAAKAFKR